MRCPVDGAELLLSERQGVEIHRCGTCRGVWLDRGELDKILDRDARLGDPAAPGLGYGDLRTDPRPPHAGEQSWLGELFGH